MSMIPSIRFHPTDTELIHFLKRFLKGETFRCPIKYAEIYGDQPPWQIFSGEEKIGYFVTSLKKRKKSDKRHVRTCANGTWRGETSATPIKNHKGCVVGFTRNYKYHSRSTCKENSNTNSWLMREYFVGDDFFKENNIPKQELVVCRIKKHVKQMKVKDYANAVTYNMDEHVVAGIIKDMLHGPDASHPVGRDQVMEEADPWDSIIDEIYNEKADEVDNTTTLMQAEYDLRECNRLNDQTVLCNTTYEAAMEIQNSTVSSSTLEEEAYADDITGSNDFWETMDLILKAATVNIPDELRLHDHQSPLLLTANENI
ncbi:unnamed protein product [Withania somnifera]